MIKTFDYLKSLAEIEDDVMQAIKRVLHSGRLILGPETTAFEQEFADYLGVEHCIAVTSGTVALQLALWSLGIGPGDEVITVSNTCAPTVAAIKLTGATPVFVDVRSDDLMMDTSLIESRITGRTRCLLPVHLWGNAVAMDEVLSIGRSHNLLVLEDCSQAYGTLYRDMAVGTLGNAGCYSFYPTKNLGAYGDAGAVVTNNAELADTLRRKRMYGYDDAGVAVEDGMNARISEIQTAILRVKLAVSSEWLNRRREIAELYLEGISNPLIDLPISSPDCHCSYHQFVVRTEQRAQLTEFLDKREIGWAIHYPTPLHKMPAYARACDLPITEKAAHQILSLPIHEAMTNDDAHAVVSAVNACFRE